MRRTNTKKEDQLHAILRKSTESSGRINRTVLILLLAVIAMLVVIIAIPAWQSFREETMRIGCEQAMKSAKDGLIIEYLGRYKEGSVEEARATLNEVMPAREKLCPSGGNVYLIRREDGIFETVCGIHDPDVKLRTRLNATYAYDQLKENLRKERRVTTGEPESVNIVVNSQDLECIHVPIEVPISRGTSTTDGYSGVVAYYGLAGEGDFSDVDAPDGTICYFVYADENYCAIWHIDDGWTGDSYT